jgi:hypothetical protein
MNCRDFREMIDSYLSDELLTETNHDVLRHLEDCPECRQVIESRRGVRRHLKSAVRSAPEYRCGNDFAHNLRTQLAHQALKDERTPGGFFTGFGSWFAVVAGLILAVTLGFVFLYNPGGGGSVTADRSSYQTAQLPSAHLVNVAFGDHEHCAVKRGTDEPVGHAETPIKYDNAETVAMPELKNILAGAELRSSHTCEYRATKFTHLIVERDGELLSVMLTERNNAESLGEGIIARYTSQRYRLARFDVKDTAVFVVSPFSEKTNTLAAETLYRPFRQYLDRRQTFQTAVLTFY